MTIREALLYAGQKLRPVQIDSAALDAEVLLSFIIKKNRGWLLAHEEERLNAGEARKFKELIKRRAKHEPVAYIVGAKEFYGLNFRVGKDVLIPRPETELMIDFLKEALGEVAGGWPLIIDVGTGSGCLAITAAKLWPKAKIIALDNSPAALKVAKSNARLHGVSGQIKFLKKNLLRGLKLAPNLGLIFLANLPYLPLAEWGKASLEVRHYEPKHALLGGPNGMRYQRELIKQVSALKQRPITILLEIDPHQSGALQKLIKKIWPRAKLEIRKDLAKLARLVIVRIPI